MTPTRVTLFLQVPVSLRTPGGCHFDVEKSGSSTYTWSRAVFYNETVFPQPQTYDPERFLKNGRLDTSVMDPEQRVFGSGRRYVLDTIT